MFCAVGVSKLQGRLVNAHRCREEVERATMAYRAAKAHIIRISGSPYALTTLPFLSSAQRVGL